MGNVEKYNNRYGKGFAIKMHPKVIHKKIFSLG